MQTVAWRLSRLLLSATVHIPTAENLEHDGKPICVRCAYVLGAPKWLDAAFTAVAEQAPRLYRALAAVFHPDQNGESTPYDCTQQR